MNPSEIVIDLDIRPNDPPAGAAGPRPGIGVRRWRTAAAVLAGILVLSAGGAAPFPAPPLREVFAAPVGPSAFYRLAGDVLVTVTPTAAATAQPGHRMTGYDLPTGRQLWSADLVVEDFTTGHPAIGVATADGVLLVSEGGTPSTQTTALDPRTGQRRWSVPYWLSALPGEPTGLVFDSVFAPESRLAPDAPGGQTETYHSADGSRYTEPPIGLVLHAVDLATGRFRWTSPRLATAATVPAADDEPTVLLTRPAEGAGVEVRDPVTGAVRHRLDWPDEKLVFAVRMGDVVAVSHSGPDPGVTGYSADLSQRRWRRSLPGVAHPFVAVCGRVLCHQDPTGGTVAFDPATGETRWRLPEPVQLTSVGSWAVEVNDDQRLSRVIDPLTGRTVGVLDGWQLVDVAHPSAPDRIPADPAQLVLRTNHTAQQTEVGLLDLARPAVRPLGVLPHALRGCTAAGRFMACRTADGQLRGWRYELPSRHRVGRALGE